MRFSFSSIGNSFSACPSCTYSETCASAGAPAAASSAFQAGEPASGSSVPGSVGLLPTVKIPSQCFQPIENGLPAITIDWPAPCG